MKLNLSYTGLNTDEDKVIITTANGFSLVATPEALGQMYRETRDLLTELGRIPLSRLSGSTKEQDKE